MHIAQRSAPRIAGLAAVVLLLLAGAGAPAQEKAGRLTIQATARGTGTEFGRIVSVNIIIESYSSPEEQQLLMEAFNKGGNEGLVSAVEKMPERGRIAITGTVGYNVNYVRVFQTPTGRRIRMVTDRPMRFGELYRGDRSTEYSLSAVEIELNDTGGEHTGTLLPVCKLYMSKEGELTIEAYRNPWKLINIMVR